MSAVTAIKLFGQRRFLPLFVLFQAGTFNDNALKQALIGLVAFGGVVLFSDNIPRGSVVPVAALLFTLPFLIFCTIAGQIADKVDRGVVLKWVKRAEVGIMIIAAIGFFLESPIILAITLVMMGTQSAFFSPTKNAVLPQWLSDDELIAGNGLLSGFQFCLILAGQTFGLLFVLKTFPEGSLITGPRIVGLVLIALAIVGWIAGESLPKAPAPAPKLKIDWNPVTAIASALTFAWRNQPVFRPMLGIAWFYGLSTIFVTAFPTYVADVMKYDQSVLIVILAASTIGILIGALSCFIFAKGREAMHLVAIGIVGVTVFTLDLYLNSAVALRDGLGTLDDFWADPASKRFLIDVVGASICNGLFVVPLQAMSQGRSPDVNRARLMSAGAVMLNLSVNSFTFILIGLGFTALPLKTPFLFIVVISALVSVYALYRVFVPPTDIPPEGRTIEPAA
ncbi:MFS transporter [Robiginitomaculum antarcticum]|uniref:MFS transporter n=1 Tax=Robiginitomaculum antarcticum TaxID=437507 RepID=UPI0003721ECE|nr:MFS transporter [Robiginitomaculum antarcticum]